MTGSPPTLSQLGEAQLRDVQPRDVQLRVVQLGDELLDEALLVLTAEQSATAWQWIPGWNHQAAVGVRGPEHLTVLISGQLLGHFGGLRHASAAVGRWSQTMRTPYGWVVEVHDGTDTDFARPVRCESMSTWTPGEAADLMWAWAHGSLPPRHVASADHLSDIERRRYGV